MSKQIIEFDFSRSSDEQEIYTAKATCTLCSWWRCKATTNTLLNQLHEEEITDLALEHANQHYAKSPEDFTKGV